MATVGDDVLDRHPGGGAGAVPGVDLGHRPALVPRGVPGLGRLRPPRRRHAALAGRRRERLTARSRRSCSTATPGTTTRSRILLALGSPGVDLLGVTTTFGNCSVEDATRNAQRVLALAGGADVPVARGAAGPMRRRAARWATTCTAPAGWTVPTCPSRTASPVDRDGGRADGQRCLGESAEPVTVVATGPITNVGVLLADQPGPDRARSGRSSSWAARPSAGNHTPDRGVQHLRRPRGARHRAAVRRPGADGRAQPDPPGARDA